MQICVTINIYDFAPAFLFHNSQCKYMCNNYINIFDIASTFQFYNSQCKYVQQLHKHLWFRFNFSILQLTMQIYVTVTQIFMMSLQLFSFTTHNTNICNNYINIYGIAAALLFYNSQLTIQICVTITLTFLISLQLFNFTTHNANIYVTKLHKHFWYRCNFFVSQLILQICVTIT
jgi:hypothetical protein